MAKSKDGQDSNSGPRIRNANLIGAGGGKITDKGKGRAHEAAKLKGSPKQSHVDKIGGPKKTQTSHVERLKSETPKAETAKRTLRAPGKAKQEKPKAAPKQSTPSATVSKQIGSIKGRKGIAMIKKQTSPKPQKRSTPTRTPTKKGPKR